MDTQFKRPNIRCFIAGAGGTIGQALLSRLTEDPQVDQIIATHRKPLSSTHPKVTWCTMDFEHPSTIACTSSQLTEQLDRLDYFICATGHLHDKQFQPEKSLSKLNLAQMQHSFLVNAAGPLQLLATLEPLLKRAANPKVQILSAQVGSIQDNRLGGWYGYRAAKAALNMGLKTAAIEASRWRNQPVFMAVHPGTTRSALSRPFITRHKGPVRDAAQTAHALYRLLQQADPSHHGGFFNAQGERLPW